MPEFPENTSKVVAAIYAHYEKRNDDWRRNHLGASILGKECARDVWLSFRWATRPEFPGRILRLFERGQREEAWLAKDLADVGVRVITHDASGEQIRVEWVGGHCGGSADGILHGLPEAPKTWHVWECKTSNTKGFRAIQKDGVKAAKPEHWAQMQIYMIKLNLERAAYFCVCKETDEIHFERVALNRTAAEKLLARGEALVLASRPPPKISEDVTFYKCKRCDQYETCQLGAFGSLERSCRTCTSSTPKPDGTWWCEYHKADIGSMENQIAGCYAHLFLTDLVGLEPVAYQDDEEGRWITYKNGDGLLRDCGRKLTEVAP